MLPFSMATYPLYEYFGMSTKPEGLPGWNIVARDFFIFALVEEVLFYYSHRMLHLPMFYSSVHKVHHEFTASIGTAAIYAHWFEFIIGNLIPAMLGPMVCGSHIVQYWHWNWIVLSSTIISHSGYQFAFLPFKGAELHDLHHETFKHNYGAIGLLDWLHGTRKYPEVKV